MKFCPNCGEPVESDTRFCTHCGFDLEQATGAGSSAATSNAGAATTSAASQSEQPAAGEAQPDRVAQLQSLSKNYFKWFVDSLKRPNEEVAAQKYFGLVSMLISALLLTVAIVAAINRCIKQVAAAASNVVTVKGLSFSMDFKLFTLVVIGILFYVLIGFGASMLGDKNNAVNFFDYVNRFGHLTNVAIIFNLILIISVYTVTFNVDSPLTFFKQLGFTLMVTMVISLIWQVGYILSINNSIHTERFNKFYVIVLAMIVLSIAFYIFGRVEWENLALDFSSEFSRYTNGLGNLF
ncbi:zinc ribbon domain-containing protein [Lactiplantibacillus garii]|uniref:Zinc ribbon domain-containing protein n=1 Tax=Lactiplantibacillus garii TaxID=2306423 RepID=A0A3R8KH32_9LACO|nr:zinc ribbon domain-containing protein [Lactiplantibacillus garii]RRK11751.1 zinc ribbon domain-containing protein [Lactiplantibacillus garii]